MYDMAFWCCQGFTDKSKDCARVHSSEEKDDDDDDDDDQWIAGF